MGGNALKHCTGRITREEYFEYSTEVIEFLELIFQQKHIAAIPKVLNKKESFGDIDIIVESDNLPDNWDQKLINEMKLCKDEYVKNGKVLSFKYKKAQVDLILTPRAEMGSAMNYFSFSDSWNCIGRLGHKLGLKVGHDGLWITVRPKDRTNHVIGNVLVSRNILTVLHILELDIKKYQEGFDTQEDVFEWLSKSKYFNPDVFLLDNRNAMSRVRDKKRVFYNELLKWCEDNKDQLNHYPFASVTEIGGYNIREPYFSEVIVPFYGDWLKKEVDETIAEYELNQKYKALFPGNYIGEVSGKEGKELGGLISFLKSTFPDKKFMAENYSIEQMQPILKTIIEGKKS